LADVTRNVWTLPRGAQLGRSNKSSTEAAVTLMTATGL
jgi:hypothetical protein